MALPTVSEVITKYLYGSDIVPADFSDDTIIRDSGPRESIDVNLIEYMTTGAGRFALASNFEIIKLFTTTRRLHP